MKIGIDAKWYFEGPPSGTRVVRSLVDHLLAVDDHNEYVIFLNRSHRKRRFPSNEKSNFSLCYVWAGNNLLSNLFILPFYSATLKIEALLYQNFISPFDKAKKIAYIHDVLFLSNPEYYTVYERLYFAPLKWLTRFSNALITVSEEEKKRLLHFNFCLNEKKITVVYHGVDSSFKPAENFEYATKVELRQKYRLPERFLLFVGRLNVRKNVDNLLVAISLLKDQSISLVIVGGVDWRKSNHNITIEKLGISDRVIFTGPVYKDLGIIYSMATVFCFPSLAESFGLPPLEAMASGVPVVVSNTTSLPEICGDAGTYIDPTNPGSIATGIDELLADEQLCLRKRELGLIQAEKFNWYKAARVTIACIESLKIKK
jgi:glycosyltransferase involved in cell wall biosynthesis